MATACCCRYLFVGRATAKCAAPGGHGTNCHEFLEVHSYRCNNELIWHCSYLGSHNQPLQVPSTEAESETITPEPHCPTQAAAGMMHSSLHAPANCGLYTAYAPEAGAPFGIRTRRDTIKQVRNGIHPATLGQRIALLTKNQHTYMQGLTQCTCASRTVISSALRP